MNRLILVPILAVLAAAPVARAADSPPDTMTFHASGYADSTGAEPQVEAGFQLRVNEDDEWLRAPGGDAILTPPELWREKHGRHGASDWDLQFDYNRVDLFRYGVRYQAQQPETMHPRVGARLGYAVGRGRTVYGVQVEQPLLPTARFVLGVGMTRLTEHPDLQQTEDIENSLLLLFAHEDWRDYYEREGYGGYLSWRVPDFSTVSVHLRSDQYRTLESDEHVWSVFRMDRPLRLNPAIDEGETRRVLVRLERLAHRTSHSRGGLYHWIELQRAGGQLGGDFTYTRGLADVRSVLRLSPAVSLSLRAVAGATFDGSPPAQETFAVGGVDGLRAHTIGAYRGDQMALAQAEYTVGLWQLHANGFQGGLHAIVFADAGTAWNHAGGWDVSAQHFAVDGGFGLSTSEDDIRVTFSRNLQKPDSGFVTTVRLNKPF